MLLFILFNYLLNLCYFVAGNCMFLFLYPKYTHILLSLDLFSMHNKEYFSSIYNVYKKALGHVRVIIFVPNRIKFQVCLVFSFFFVVYFHKNL